MKPEDLAGAPQAVLDAALPPIEVPAVATTYYFTGGTSHSILAPDTAFSQVGADIVVQETNGQVTRVCMAHVLYVVTRQTTMKIKQKAGKP